MDHPLDRPVWSALSTRQLRFAVGDERARRFVPEFGLFAAAVDDRLESQSALAALIPPGLSVATVETGDGPVPPGLTVAGRAICNQMIAERLIQAESAVPIEPLTNADACEMLALATLTRPGPFFGRTHEMGKFVGVRHGGRLVAMAGERMMPTGYTEVSGVCTHPEHRGRGYAAALMRSVASCIHARGEVPFLHVYATNSGAVALYESLGFVFRRTVTMTVLARE